MSTLWANPIVTKAVEAHHVIFCTIFDSQGEILRRYNGNLCLFRDDGGFFSSSGDGLSAWDKSMNRIWQRPYFIHHQLNWSLDKSQILALGSEFTKQDGKPVRTDALYIFDLNGTLMKKFSYNENMKMLEKLFPNQKSFLQVIEASWHPRKAEVEYEYTHANSFYEIPSNTSGAKIAAFAKGNYIVNDVFIRRILIFDRFLKKILWSLDYSLWGGNVIHDVQVLPNGHLFIYANEAQFKNGVKASELHEFDPIKNKIVWRFTAKPSQDFFSFACGGVQLLDNGNILYSDISSGQAYGIEITRSGKEIWRMSSPDKDVKSGKKTPIQQVKRVDLSGFLKNNIGL